MFGMVAATGIKILSAVDFKTNRNNLFIVAIGIGMGMLTLIAPNIFDHFPKALKPILDSGILLTTFVTVLLNAFLSHPSKTENSSQNIK